MQDHRLETQTVFPATAYLEMALAAGQHIYQTTSLQLEQFSIKQPLLLSDNSTTLQTVLIPETDSYYI